MDREQVRAFRDRWQAVAEVEREERRTASMALRWRQLNAVMRLARGLGLDARQMDDGEEIVWQRWARLKELQEQARIAPWL